MPSTNDIRDDFSVVEEAVTKILLNEPEGLPYGRLIQLVKQLEPNISINTIHSAISDIVRGCLDAVYCPSIGIYRHIKFKSIKSFGDNSIADLVPKPASKAAPNDIADDDWSFFNNPPGERYDPEEFETALEFYRQAASKFWNSTSKEIKHKIQTIFDDRKTLSNKSLEKDGIELIGNTDTKAFAGFINMAASQSATNYFIETYALYRLDSHKLDFLDSTIYSLLGKLVFDGIQYSKGLPSKLDSS